MTERPLASLTDDEKFVITTLYDVRCNARRFPRVRPEDALSGADVQRLTLWPGARPMGKARVSAALRFLTSHGLAVRTRPDVYRC